MMHRSLASTLRQVSSRRALSTASVLLRQSLYDFDKVQNLVSSPTPSKVLIDVREPHEYEAGSIPTSRNLPLSSFESTLALDDAAFERTTGFAKPDKEAEVIFYCKSGVRSTSASNLAEKLGYGEVGNYKGSWSEWSSRSPPASPSSPAPSESFSSEPRAGAPVQGTPSGGQSLGNVRQYSTDAKKRPNPNEVAGAGEGAEGGIDLKAMNQREEKRAEPAKRQEKQGKPLTGAKEGESESVTSGSELSGNKRFE